MRKMLDFHTEKNVLCDCYYCNISDFKPLSQYITITVCALSKKKKSIFMMLHVIMLLPGLALCHKKAADFYPFYASMMVFNNWTDSLMITSDVWFVEETSIHCILLCSNDLRSKTSWNQHLINPKTCICIYIYT